MRVLLVLLMLVLLVLVEGLTIYKVGLLRPMICAVVLIRIARIVASSLTIVPLWNIVRHPGVWLILGIFIIRRALWTVFCLVHAKAPGLMGQGKASVYGHIRWYCRAHATHWIRQRTMLHHVRALRPR